MLRIVFLTLLWKNRDSFAHKYHVNLEEQTGFSILQHRGSCYGEAEGNNSKKLGWRQLTL